MPVYDTTINSVATKYKSDQKHIYANGGNDYINLQFASINVFSHGHHVRGEVRQNADMNAPGYELGEDAFNFTQFGNVTHTVSGRIEDFDYSRDDIMINGVALDLSSSGSLPSNVRIVSYNGDHNDAGADDQQYILIDTGSGHIFYALEGARIDMNGDGAANGGEQERHFLDSPPNFSQLQDVQFIDQRNFVPLSKMPGNPANFAGKIINDIDETIADVQATISGGSQADLIAGGLNDDIIQSGNGNDSVWGGSGHDSIKAGGANDSVEGGTGNDTLNGQSGNDKIYGQWGDDRVLGGSGNDLMYGQTGNDSMYGGNNNDTLKGGSGNDYLSGQNGNDRIDAGNNNDKVYGGGGSDTLNGNNGHDTIDGGSSNDTINGGGGNDRITGGTGRDIANGGSGDDTFVFKTGHMVNFYSLSGSNTSKYTQIDRIDDYDIGDDHIDLSAVSGVNSMSDLTVWKPSEYSNGDHFSISVKATGDRILVETGTGVSYSDFVDTLLF